MEPLLHRVRSVKKLVNAVGLLAARTKYVRYVALEEDLDQREQGNLDQLFAYEDVTLNVASSQKAEADSRAYIYVSPRTGTISLWSSKATSIAHVCGLNGKVKRIERFIIYFVSSSRNLLTDDP